MIIIKIHTAHDGHKVIALCDKKILGNVIEEGNKQLDCSSNFYKGEEKNNKEIIEIIGVNNVHINAVGEESVNLCIEQKWCDIEDIKKVSNIPHIEIVIQRD